MRVRPAFLVRGIRLDSWTNGLKGSDDFNLNQMHDATPFPMKINGSPDCHGYSGFGSGFAFQPVSGALEEAALVFRTNDSTSPTVRVPILFDHTGELTYDDPQYPPPEYSESVLTINPNPIRIGRLPVGESSTTSVCLGGSADVITIAAKGDGLSIATSSPSEIVIDYSPVNDDPVDGALVIDYLNHWGDNLTHVAPILVR